MKTIILSIMVCCIVAGCNNNYKDFNGTVVVTGYATINDSPSIALPLPLSKQAIYLSSSGTDTSIYEFQTITDSGGRFSFSGLAGTQKERAYFVFTKYTRNSVPYYGSTYFTLSSDNPNPIIRLSAYPQHLNGMFLTFKDITAGRIPNLPFRIYTSALAARYDSSGYAYVNAQSNINGEYARYDIPVGRYYVVSKDTLGGTAYAAFDSVDVSAGNIVPVTVILR